MSLHALRCLTALCHVFCPLWPWWHGFTCFHWWCSVFPRRFHPVHGSNSYYNLLIPEFVFDCYNSFGFGPFIPVLSLWTFPWVSCSDAALPFLLISALAIFAFFTCPSLPHGEETLIFVSHKNTTYSQLSQLEYFLSHWFKKSVSPFLSLHSCLVQNSRYL